MARKPRFNLMDIPQHVVQRGNRRQVAFSSEQDFRHYLGFLSDAATKYSCSIHAYVLMSNHVHLLATPRQPQGIPLMMQSVGRRYLQYVSDNYKHSGTLWDGRYKASHVQSERYLLICSRYIEDNPVRAGIVERREDYPWTSYRSNALGANDVLLTTHTEYEALGTTPEQRQQAYRSLFQVPLEPATLNQLRTALNHEQVTGGDRFKTEIEKALNRRAQLGQRGRPRKRIDAVILKESAHEKPSLMEE